MSVSDKKVCGIIMPISALDGCNELHWSEVQKILSDSIEDAGFSGNIVSNADDATLIHKTIIQNLYDNPVVVCDISGKNPNVMLELGIRLAFDKPTIIVKDDKTSYSFDTSGIEHVEYPRDLRFSRIVEFKKKLAEKIKATYEKSISDPEYTTFLKHFGEFKVAKLDKKEVSGEELIMDELKNLRTAIRRLERGTSSEALYRDRDKAEFYNSRKYLNLSDGFDLCLGERTSEEAREAMKIALTYPGVNDVAIRERAPQHFHLIVKTEDSTDIVSLEKAIGGKCQIVNKYLKKASG